MGNDYQINVEGIEIVIEENKRNDVAEKFRLIRTYAGMNRKAFAAWLHIPYDTMCDWESGERKMPEYVFELIAYKVANEKQRGNI